MATSLLVVSIPLLRRAGVSRSGPPAAQAFVAHAVRLGAGIATMHLVEAHYTPGSDAHDYHLAALEIAPRLRAGRLREAITLARTAPWDTQIRLPVGTNFVRLFTGGVYSVCGPEKPGSFLIFSSVGFWGSWCFARAFALGARPRRADLYARLVFGWPSIMFWSSSVGKEAWMSLGLGMGALGTAHITRGRFRRGLALSGAGASLVVLVRPQLASYFGLRSSPVAAEWAQAGVSLEGSWFSPPELRSLSDVPAVMASVLFRPHPGEAHNAAALAAALEGTSLLVLSAARGRALLATLKTVPGRPFVALMLGSLGVCTVLLSPLANFGLLARERAPILPLYLMFLCG